MWCGIHEPVMVSEVLEAMQVHQGGTYVDGTLGSGGHALAVLSAMGGRGRLLGLDCDAEALVRASARLAPWAGQCRFEQCRFSNMEQALANAGWSGVDGALLDLGVSSEQLETSARGFSFNREGPLDMRMDNTSKTRTAADLVNGLDMRELERVFSEFGEEPRARRIAKAVLAAREQGPLLTTLALAEVVKRALGAPECRRIHPATRVFQALRIMVNRELDELSAGLEAGLRVLAPGGRLAVISYHSLEDRIVKRCFREHAGRKESLAEGGWRRIGIDPPVRIIGRPPQRPSSVEESANPRSRSAKLRVVERKESL